MPGVRDATAWVLDKLTWDKKFHRLLVASEQLSPEDVIVKFYATKAFDLKSLFAEHDIGLKYLSIWESKYHYDAPWLDERYKMSCLVDLNLSRSSLKGYYRAVYMIPRTV